MEHCYKRACGHTYHIWKICGPFFKEEELAFPVLILTRLACGARITALTVND